jgi:hypothetical protein|nr:MAG: hypothetical protein [Bacteriophage sp.]
MKEEVLTKAIELKKQLDYQRRVLKLGNSVYTSIKVYFEDELIHDNVRITDDVLGDNVIKELKAKAIANIEKRINDLLEELEKL